MLFLIFFVFGFRVWFSEHKASNFPMAISFSDFEGILSALWQHCFPVYCPVAPEGFFDTRPTRMVVVCTMAVRQVCSDLLLSGLNMLFSFSFLFYSMFYNFIMCMISYC